MLRGNEQLGLGQRERRAFGIGIRSCPQSLANVTAQAGQTRSPVAPIPIERPPRDPKEAGEAAHDLLLARLIRVNEVACERVVVLRI